MPNLLIGPENGTLSASRQATRRGFTKTASLTFTVVSETLATDEESIMDDTPGLPILLGLYGTGLGQVVCTSVDPSQEYPTKHPVTGNEAYVWKVECQFTSDISDLYGGSALSTPPVIRYNGSQITLRSNFDGSGNPITNFFQEPLFYDATVPVGNLTIERFEPLSTNIIDDIFTRRTPYEGTCNLGSFHGLPEGTCLMQPIQAQPETRNGLTLDRVVYTISVLLNPFDQSQADTWTEDQIPHRSNYYVITRDGVDFARWRTPEGQVGPFDTEVATGRLVNQINGSLEHVPITKKRKVDWGPLLI